MKKNLFYALGFLLACSTISCEIEPYGGAPQEVDAIAQEDALYNYLGLVSQESDNELTDLGCVEFIYPFILFQYDEELEYVQQFSVTGNENFVALLTNLEEGHSIGLSYPIAGTLADGSSITVSSNEELQASLENCIQEELEIILGNCNAIVEDCVWQVTESSIEENPYIDSFFTMRDDGSILFTVNEEEQPKGTWIFYFIGFDLHMNINFGPTEPSEDETDTELVFKTADWNFDWKIVSIDEDRIEIENSENVRYTLEKICEEAADETPE